MKHEPFAQTWTGIVLQLFIVAALIWMTLTLWLR